MSVTRNIAQSWRAPRTVLRALLAGDQREAQPLIYLMLACAIVFVAQWPGLARTAHLDPSVPLEARMGATLLAWLFIAPLLFYAIAGLSHVVARALGGQGTGFGARLALFWALLAVAPVWLLHGLVAGFIGPGAAYNLVGAVLLAGFLYIWLSGLREAEGFAPLFSAGRTK